MESHFHQTLATPPAFLIFLFLHFVSRLSTFDLVCFFFFFFFLIVGELKLLFQTMWVDFRFEMDISEARLDRIEVQSSVDASHDRLRKIYVLMNKIYSCFRSLSSRGFFRAGVEATPQPMEDTEPVPEFFISLRLSDLCDLPGEYVLMKTEMLSTLSDGNEEWLETLRSHGTPLACLKNDQGDSILHLAAT